MHIQVTLSEEPFVLEATNDDGMKIHLDAAPAIGGKGKGMRPMELLAASLAGCMSIDVLSILRKQRQAVTHFEIAVDARRKQSVPSSFETIVLTFVVNTEVDIEKLQYAVRLSHEKYCSVSQSLHPDIQIHTQTQHVI